MQKARRFKGWCSLYGEYSLDAESKRAQELVIALWGVKLQCKEQEASTVGVWFTGRTATSVEVAILSYSFQDGHAICFVWGMRCHSAG